jgi:hypothetical protein
MFVYWMSLLSSHFSERKLSHSLPNEQAEDYVEKGERCCLKQIGRADLAKKEGGSDDGLEYDACSFNPGRDEKSFFGGKIASRGKYDFFVGDSEQEVTRERINLDGFYRVDDFQQQARIHHLEGDVDQYMHLQPQSNMASLN